MGGSQTMQSKPAKVGFSHTAAFAAPTKIPIKSGFIRKNLTPARAPITKMHAAALPAPMNFDENDDKDFKNVLKIFNLKNISPDKKKQFKQDFAAF